MPSWNRVTNQRTATAATKVFPEAWHAFTATRDRLATARRMSSWSGQRSWRKRPRQNRTGSRTTSARAVASSACASAFGIHHHRLDECERQERLAILSSQLHALRRFGEATVGEPCGGFEAIAQLHPFNLAAKHAHDEGHQFIAVARLLTNGADDALRAAGRVPGLPFGKWPPRTARRRCSYAVLSQLSGRAHSVNLVQHLAGSHRRPRAGLRHGWVLPRGADAIGEPIQQRSSGPSLPRRAL